MKLKSTKNEKRIESLEIRQEVSEGKIRDIFYQGDRLNACSIEICSKCGGCFQKSMMKSEDKIHEEVDWDKWARVMYNKELKNRYLKKAIKTFYTCIHCQAKEEAKKVLKKK